MRNSAAAGLLLAAAVAPLAAAAAPDCAPDRLVITPTASVAGGVPIAVEIAVEIADDAAERAQGLMHRRDLPPQTGMLFVYDTPQPVAFWMKNTLIPLDMLFIDAAGVIRRVHARARPMDETPIPGAAAGDPDPMRQFVLELPGGEAARLGIAEGDIVSHPAISPARAAIPCR